MEYGKAFACLVENLAKEVHVKTVKICGVDVPADEDWDVVARRQKIQLSTMARVVDKLTRIGCRIFLTGGGCIGLMRHGGHIIPWDDDVDLIMPSDDYEKGIDALSKDPIFDVLEFSRTDDFRLGQAKIAVKELLAEVCGDDKRGAYIDIFILDPVPANKISQWVCKQHRKLLGNVLLYRMKCLTGWRKMVSGMLSPFCPKEISTLKTVLRTCSRTGDSFDQLDENKLVGEIFCRYGVKSYMPWGVYCDCGEIRYAQFEGVRIAVPYNIEEYLRRIYGEWRNMPPLEKRRPAHGNDDPWLYSEWGQSRGIK